MESTVSLKDKLARFEHCEQAIAPIETTLTDPSAHTKDKLVHVYSWTHTAQMHGHWVHVEQYVSMMEGRSQKRARSKRRHWQLLMGVATRW